MDSPENSGLRLRRGQRGISMIEMTIAMSIGTLIMGSVIMVQMTATENFSGSVSEVRVTQTMRDGVGDMKQELRSILASSIWVHPMFQNSSSSTPIGNANGVTLTVGNIGSLSLLDEQTIFSFQQAIGFNSSTGATTWGGGRTADAVVEYYLSGNKLKRRVRTSTDSLIPSEERTLVNDLDMTLVNGPPVAFLWDEGTGFLGITVRTYTKIDNKPIRRAAETVVHLESCFKF